MSADEEARRKLEKPAVGTAQAASLALELFGLTAEPDSLKELDSYDDRNFLLRTASGKQFVLKVHNGVESQVPAFIEAQNEAMGCARDVPGLWCPWPCLSVRGSPIEYAELALPDGSPRRHAVRCLPFLPARLLGDVAPTCKLLWELGACAAKLDQALTAVTHRAAWREHAWDLRSTCELEGLVHHLEPSQLDAVRAVIDEFRQEVLPGTLTLTPTPTLTLSLTKARSCATPAPLPRTSRRRPAPAASSVRLATFRHSRRPRPVRPAERARLVRPTLRGRAASTARWARTTRSTPAPSACPAPSTRSGRRWVPQA